MDGAGTRSAEKHRIRLRNIIRHSIRASQPSCPCAIIRAVENNLDLTRDSFNCDCYGNHISPEKSC